MEGKFGNQAGVERQASLSAHINVRRRMDAGIDFKSDNKR